MSKACSSLSTIPSATMWASWNPAIARTTIGASSLPIAPVLPEMVCDVGQYGRAVDAVSQRTREKVLADLRRQDPSVIEPLPCGFKYSNARLRSSWSHDRGHRGRALCGLDQAAKSSMRAGLKRNDAGHAVADRKRRICSRAIAPEAPAGRAYDLPWRLYRKRRLRLPAALWRRRAIFAAISRSSRRAPERSSAFRLPVDGR